MQFTRPNVENPLHSDVFVTASTQVAERLIEELGASEWGSRIRSVGDVPGFSIEFTLDLGVSTVFEATISNVRLDAWLDAALARIVGGIPSL